MRRPGRGPGGQAAPAALRVHLARPPRRGPHSGDRRRRRRDRRRRHRRRGAGGRLDLPPALVEAPSCAASRSGRQTWSPAAPSWSTFTCSVGERALLRSGSGAARPGRGRGRSPLALPAARPRRRRPGDAVAGGVVDPAPRTSRAAPVLVRAWQPGTRRVLPPRRRGRAGPGQQPAPARRARRRGPPTAPISSWRSSGCGSRSASTRTSPPSTGGSASDPLLGPADPPPALGCGRGAGPGPGRPSPGRSPSS